VCKHLPTYIRFLIRCKVFSVLHIQTNWSMRRWKLNENVRFNNMILKISPENRVYGRRWSATPVYPQKLALTSPASDCRPVGIVRSRTQATEFFLFCFNIKNPFKNLLLYIYQSAVTGMEVSEKKRYIRKQSCCNSVFGIQRGSWPVPLNGWRGWLLSPGGLPSQWQDILICHGKISGLLCTLNVKRWILCTSLKRFISS
jgi:hypothetical protein